ELSPRMFKEYKNTTDLLVKTFGKSRLVSDLASTDFESLRESMAKVWGPVRLSNEVQKVRTVFKYAYEAGLLQAPVRFGPQFKKPSASTLRRHRAKAAPKMLEPEQLRKLIDAAPTPIRAMVLLGLNAGYGPHDVAALPLTALNLEGSWANFSRPKTGISRRTPLWPETVAALRETLAARPTPRQE